jgi:hypothetical protein
VPSGPAPVALHAGRPDVGGNVDRTTYRTVRAGGLSVFYRGARPGGRPRDLAAARISLLLAHVAAAARPARGAVPPRCPRLSRVRAQRRAQPHRVRVHLRPSGRGGRQFHSGDRSDQLHPRRSGLRRPGGTPARGRASGAAGRAHCPERRGPRGRELSLRHWDVGQHGVCGGLVPAERARLRHRWPVREGMG